MWNISHPPPYENAPRHRAQDVYGLCTPLRPYIIVPDPHKSMVFQIDILTLCKLVAHSILMSSSFCINEHLKKSLSEAQRQTTETQQIA